MKKIFTLSLLLVLTLTANAQYRKSWDFTKWSDATHANLIAGSDWSDIEKAADTAPTDISKENCFWQVGNSSAGISPMTANGEPIKELEGLKFINSTTRSLAIAVNYPATSLGEYHPICGWEARTSTTSSSQALKLELPSRLVLRATSQQRHAVCNSSWVKATRELS